jgi:hypothetical protein
MDRTRSLASWLTAAVLALALATCGDDKPWECEKPADCVGRPSGNYCKEVSGKGLCVIECLLGADGKDTCPPTYTCTGKADDGSLYCKI